MSPIDQPLMLLELLGRRSPAPAQDVTRQILGSAWWAGFTFNGITAYGDGHDSLIGGDALSDGERDALLELFRQNLDDLPRAARRRGGLFVEKPAASVTAAATAAPSAAH